MTDESLFFQDHGLFLAAHTTCSSGREGLQTHVWLPADQPDQCFVTFTCTCGASVELPATREEAFRIAEALRNSGSLVTESDRAKARPDEPPL